MLMQAQYSGSGDGTANSPYLIYNEVQLSQVSNFLNQSDVYFKLMKDLDLTSFISENYPSEGWTPIGVSSSPFKGKFDGNNHKLSGLWINKSTISYVGFFGYVDGATISNLTLEGSNILGVNQVGALVGYANNASITGCTVTFSDKIQGSTNVGGLIGQTVGGTITGSTVNTAVKGSTSTGGLVGTLSSTNISTSQVNGNIEGSGNTAGIVGTVDGTQAIQNVTHIGDVSGSSNVSGIAGELASGSSTTFTACFSKGEITNTGDYTGGIVGKSNEIAIAAMSDCSHFGDITGKQYIGGLIGGVIWGAENDVYISTSSTSNTKTASISLDDLRNSGIVENLVNNCTAIGNISGTSYIGGLIGKDEKAFSCSNWVSGGSKSISGSWKGNAYSSSASSTAYIWYGGQNKGSKQTSSVSYYDYDYSGSTKIYYFNFSITFYPNIQASALGYTNSYYSGIINGTDNVGGIAGHKTCGKIQNCYTNASIYANNQVGGIIGSAEGVSGANVTLKSNVAINNTISATVSNIGRIYGKCDSYTTIGALASAEGNRALTTTKVILKGVVQEITDNLQHGNVMGSSLLKLKANYVALGWDFDTNWAIMETECYPYKKYQAAPPVIESDLVSQGTTISGSSTNGGTVYLYYKDREAVSTQCNGNAWSFTTEPLQSGASVQLYSDVEGMTPSYLVSTTVGYLGSGTEADPYRIYTAADLQGACNRGYYKIMNDIDLTNWINENSPKSGWVAIGRNSGESTYINGDGHKITGLWINTTDDYTGLFSNFSAGIIKNLTVEVANGKSVKGGNYTGILIGRNANGQIINCDVKGAVEGTGIVGGVVGYSENNNVENVAFSGTVTSSTSGAKVGGFAGQSNKDQLSLIRTDATITVTNSSANVGGIVGYTASSVLNKTKAQANISVSGSASYVGGVVGYSQSAISESFSTGSVTCTGDESYTGGLVGMAKANITDSYSTANVTGTLHTAGLCAYTYNKIDKCYAKGSINGVTYGAGVVSNLDGASAEITNCVALNNTLSLTAQSSWGSRVIGGFRNGAAEPNTTNFALDAMQVSLNGVPQTKTDDNVEGIAKPASELMNIAFYTALGWDMGPVWSIESGMAYPFLLWEVDVTLVTELSINKAILSMAQGKSDTLVVTALPLYATNKNVTWASSNENVVTVEEGVVSAVGVGNATVTATTTDGSNISVSCAINVVANKDEAISDLQDLIDYALELYNNSVEGENIGQYQIGSRAELYAVIVAVSNQVSDVMTDDQISTCLNQLNNAIETFLSKKVTSGGNTDLTQFNNVVYFNDLECRSGSAATLSIQMRNQDPVIGFNFKVYLPEGVTVVTNTDEWGDEMIDAGLSGNRTSASRHTFETALNKDGVLTVLCYSTKTYSFNGNDGEVGYIKLNIEESVEEGEYPIIIREEAISLANSTPQISYIKSSIIVSKYKLGDANGDTYINVGDITAVASHILENTPADFVAQAADANEDKAINVGDITTIATMILNDANYAPARRIAQLDAEAQYTMAVSQVSDNSMVLNIGAINTDNAFSAFQFDIRLPENVQFADIQLQDRCQHLEYDMTIINNNTLRVIAYSISDERVSMSSGDMVSIELNGITNDEFVLTNGVFANSNQTIYAEDVVTSRKAPTSVSDVTTENKSEIYDILGRKLNAVQKGIQIIGNKVVFVY